MAYADTHVLLDGFWATEGLRWHDERLWFCDIYGEIVYCYDEQTNCHQWIEVGDQPAGLGWLSDGTLLITTMRQRQLLQYRNNALSVYHSLDLAAPGYCHDFTVSPDDTIYLSTSGFYPGPDVTPIKSSVLMILPDQTLLIAATNMGYPNGIIITPEGQHLLVSETFASRIACFDMNTDGTLENRQYWAEFDELGFQVTFDQYGKPQDMTRHYPDGICFDNPLSAVWMASPARKEVICVTQSGQIVQTIKTQSHPFDCVLGGASGRTLFIASSDLTKEHPSGKIEVVQL